MRSFLIFILRVIAGTVMTIIGASAVLFFPVAATLGRSGDWPEWLMWVGLSPLFIAGLYAAAMIGGWHPKEKKEHLPNDHIQEGE